MTSMLCRRAFLMCVAAGLVGCAAIFKPDVSTDKTALRSGEYALDPDHRALIFKIDHLGYSQFVGRFEKFDAILDFDAANPSDAHVEAIIDMSSLDIGNDDFAATLMGPGWFDAMAFPQAAFRSTNIEITGGNAGRAIGDLTLNGVTAPAQLTVTFNGGGADRLRGGAYVVGFSARATISRSAFGVDRLSGLIADDVAIEIEAEFLRE